MRGNFNRGRGGGGGGGGFRGRGGFRGSPYPKNNFRGGDRGGDGDGFRMRRGGGNFQMRRGDGDDSFGKDRRSFSPRGGFNRGRGGGGGGGGRGRGGFQDRRNDGGGRGGHFRGGFNQNKRFFDKDSDFKSGRRDEDDDDEQEDKNDNNFAESGSDSGSSENVARKPQKAKPEDKNAKMKQQKHKKFDDEEDDSEDDAEDIDFDEDDDDEDDSEGDSEDQNSKKPVERKKPEDSFKLMKLDLERRTKGQPQDLQGKRKADLSPALTPAKKVKGDNNKTKQQASDDDDDDEDESDDDLGSEDEEDDESESDSGDKKSKLSKAGQNVKGQKAPFEPLKKQQPAKREEKMDISPVRSALDNKPVKVKELAREAQSARSQWLEQTNVSRLYLGQLPPHCTKEDLKGLSPDIVDVFIPSSGKKRKNLYAFLSFESTAKAEENLKRLQNTKMGNQPIVVNMAHQKPPQSQQQQQQQNSLKGKNLRSVYVSGLPQNATLPDVVNHFPSATKASIEHQKRSAILIFLNEVDAANAIKANQGLTVKGTQVSVDYSRMAGEQTNTNKFLTPAKDAAKSAQKEVAKPKELKSALKSTPKEVAKSAQKSLSAAKFPGLSMKEAFKPKFVSKDSEDDDDDDDDEQEDEKQTKKSILKNKSFSKFQQESDEDDSDDDEDDDDDIEEKKPSKKNPVTSKNSGPNRKGVEQDDSEDDEDDDDDDSEY